MTVQTTLTLACSSCVIQIASTPCRLQCKLNAYYNDLKDLMHYQRQTV